MRHLARVWSALLEQLHPLFERVGAPQEQLDLLVLVAAVLGPAVNLTGLAAGGEREHDDEEAHSPRIVHRARHGQVREIRICDRQRLPWQATLARTGARGTFRAKVAPRMPRTPMLLMSTGAGALLLGLFLLWQSTRSEAVPVQPTVSPHTPEVSAAPPAPTVRARKSTPIPSAPAAPRAVHSEQAPSMPTPLPSLVPTKPPPKPLSNRNLQFGGKQLRAQTKAVEPLVRACIAKAHSRPTGTAYLNYVVAKREDTFVIEETGVEPSGTTIEDEDLLKCLHETANGMKFIGLPRDAETIMATRMVTIDHGKLTQYKHVTFTYLR